MLAQASCHSISSIFLKCGDLEEGFARVRCPDRHHEMFVAYSCKQRCTCPSRHQKRTLLTALYVGEEVCAPVAHRQVVLTILKRLRLHARFDRNLMGKLAHCAWTCIQKEVRRHLGRDDLVPRYGRDHTDNRADRTRSGVLPYRLLPLFGSLLQSLCLILVIADMTSTRM